MGILNKLSIKNLKLNKKRIISTIIGIVLSVALICAVATMATSFQETLIQNAINESGYYHIKISNVSQDDIKEIQSNRNIKEIYETKKIGYAKLEKSKNEYKPYVQLYSMNNQTFENLKFNLIKGSFPKNENELIISEHIISNGKVKMDVGDSITIDIGNRTLEGKELVHDELYTETEQIINQSRKTFKIVGIIEQPSYVFENYGNPSYTIITTNMNKENTDLYAVLENPKEFKTAIPRLLGANNYNEIENLSSTEKLKFEEWKINNELLRWEAFAFSDSTVKMLYVAIGVVISIIIFTSIFCIRNSFAISTTEKIKMYGMLSTVGATKKQIKKNVIFEAMILGVIGIPLGILAGFLADFILIKIVNALLEEFLFANSSGIIFKASIIPVIISVTLGFVTIYLSAISSAKKAAKISPIEQVKNSNQIKIKDKQLKTPKIIEKVFKTGGVLAYKNLKRSKKKYRTTVISITVSIFIFIAMNAFVTNMFDLTENYYKDYNYNVELYSGLEKLSEEELKIISSLDNMEEKFTLYREKNFYLGIKDLSKINQVQDKELSEYFYYEEGKDDPIYTGEKASLLSLKALDDESFKKYCAKIGADYEKIKDQGILCDKNQSYNKENGEVKETRRYVYKEDDIITGIHGGKETNVKVGAVTDIKPYGIERIDFAGGYLIFNYDTCKDFDFIIQQISINSNNADKLQEDIEKLDLDIKISNIDAEVRAQKAMILIIKIFLYGFIAVITLIGVTNIFNTITSNMELRQKEFAMLKSIGMTKKEFNRMINLETLFYGTKSLAFGIVLGLLGTLVMYIAFSVKIDSKVYIPVNPIILSIIFVFILIFIIMRYSIAKINKQNTIETIRKDNI